MTDLGCRISEDRNECIQRYHGNEDHENEEDELAYERAGEILERVHVEVTEESLRQGRSSRYEQRRRKCCCCCCC